MLEIGDKVRVKPPFEELFPGVWEITGIDADTGALQINGGKDFDPIHLEKVV